MMKYNLHLTLNLLLLETIVECQVPCFQIFAKEDIG